MAKQPRKELAYAQYLIKERSTHSTINNNNSSNNKVKLCGYLKKKRNKVGGWRKMWFVLQDKLLLSYASKEEYDTKLVSFKDVLNLVPGTLVRPLGGFRFTIETTTQALYTFHCEDRSAYREWITMLVESLTATTHASHATPHRLFGNISMDNIPHALHCNACSSHRNRAIVGGSYESITHAEHVVEEAAIVATGCVRLPIARNTAKILERNGVNSSDLPALCHKQWQDFRYSEPHFPLPQTTRYLQQQQQRNQQYLQNNNWNRHIGTSQLSLWPHCDRLQTPTPTPAPTLTSILTPPLLAPKQQLPCRDCDAYETNQKQLKGCEPQTETISSTRERRALSMVKDSIQRLSIRGSRELTLDSLLGDGESAGWNQKQKDKVTATNSIERVIMQTPLPDPAPSPGGEPVYAVVDLKHKYAQRKLRNLRFELKRCNSYDSIMQCHTTDARDSRCNEQCISLSDNNDDDDDDDIEGIYEDGEAFGSGNVNGSRRHSFNRVEPTTTADDVDDEEENIYEPINIRANANSSGNGNGSTSPNAFWKYFTRLKVNSMRQLTRMRSGKYSPDYDTIKTPTSRVANPSHFSSIKHKFGTHRKSMQVRVRKLCARATEPRPFFRHRSNKSPDDKPTTTNNNNTNDSQKKSKYHWKSVKLRRKNVTHQNDDGKAHKPLFGSLPHVRNKARISLFSSQHLHQQ